MYNGLENSQTRINLMKAFAGECQARTRYDIASEKAAKQQLGFISRMLAFTAAQEKEHAQIFFNYLSQLDGTAVTVENADYPAEDLNDIIKLLRKAQNDEYNEHDNVYPEFAKTARDEGYGDIADSFERIAEIEKTHGDRFGCFAQLLESSSMFKGNEDTEWICLNCGHIFKGAQVPEQCPVCSHGQGFFVPYKYYHFIAEKYSIGEFC